MGDTKGVRKGKEDSITGVSLLAWKESRGGEINGGCDLFNSKGGDT